MAVVRFAWMRMTWQRLRLLGGLRSCRFRRAVLLVMGAVGVRMNADCGRQLERPVLEAVLSLGVEGIHGVTMSL